MKLTRNKLSFFNSLKQKKNREEAGLFMVEGEKSVREVLASGWKIQALVAHGEWLKDNPGIQIPETWEAETADLERLSSFKTPPLVAATVGFPTETPWTPDLFERRLCLGLDGIQDPGNLGTILRLADWFGITDVFCSAQTADPYNPKTIQASMGSFLRVQCRTADLKALATQVRDRGCPVWGTFLNGQNLYQAPLKNNGLLVFGNEGNGISADLEALTTHKLTIPPYPPQGTTESLNVAVAAAIVCAEFRRQAAL